MSKRNRHCWCKTSKLSVRGDSGISLYLKRQRAEGRCIRAGTKAASLEGVAARFAGASVLAANFRALGFQFSMLRLALLLEWDALVLPEGRPGGLGWPVSLLLGPR